MKKLYLVLLGFAIFIVSMHARVVVPKFVPQKSAKTKKTKAMRQQQVQEPHYRSGGYQNYIESVRSGYKGNIFELGIRFTQEPVFVFNPTLQESNLGTTKTLQFLMPYTGMNLALQDKLLATKYGNNDFSIIFEKSALGVREKVASMRVVITYNSSLYGFSKSVTAKEVICKFIPLLKN